MVICWVFEKTRKDGTQDMILSFAKNLMTANCQKKGTIIVHIKEICNMNRVYNELQMIVNELQTS